MDTKRAKAAVLQASRELVQRGLVARTWGNVSCRIDSARFAITPSGIGYDRLTPGEIVVVDIASLEYAGDVAPSSEKGIHAAAYRIDPACGFVVHTHQTAASAISVIGLDHLVPAEGPYAEWHGIGCAGYGLPGSQRLMNAVVKLLDEGIPTVLMQRHGALVVAADSQQAFDRAMALEAACAQLIPEWELLSSEGPKAVVTRGDGSLTSAPFSAILSRCPTYQLVMCFDSPIVERAARDIAAGPRPGQAAAIPAMLDDFAQMAGLSMPVLPGAGPNRTAAALRRRNCAYVEGTGLLCCAAEASDCEALRNLAEKNALAFLVAQRFGMAKGLPLLDRFLMRRAYLSHYSRKK